MSETPSDRTLERAPDPALERLIGLVAELKEEQCLAELTALLGQGYPAAGLLDACIEGMRRVGDLFEKGEYFIAALIMAGEIMRRATELLHPHLHRGRTVPVTGKVLVGTIQGDIHDLGKNLLILLLQSHGFEVVDLGVDVPPEAFVTRAREERPDVVGISCVLTLGVDRLKEAVAMLHAELPEARPPVVIGGACIDAQIARFVDADHWAGDAVEGVRICRGVVEGK